MYNSNTMMQAVIDNKNQKKIDKLDKEMERAKTDLEKSRETTKDSMKKSFEDLELWKQKELAKGKNPEKVEKQYQRGLKTVERIDKRLDKFHDRMETKVDIWEFKGRMKLEKAAHKKMIKKVATSSLAKMEKILVENPNSELRYTIAGYCGIVKKDSLNQYKHPNILKEVTKWENALRVASKDDEYFQTFLSLVDEGDKKERKLRFKIKAAEKVNQIIDEENISIRFISEFTNIKYANLYNFLKKEIYTELSFRRTHQLLWSTINIKNGWSKEEMMFKYGEKIKIIHENWDKELEEFED